MHRFKCRFRSRYCLIDLELPVSELLSLFLNEGWILALLWERVSRVGEGREVDVRGGIGEDNIDYVICGVCNSDGWEPCLRAETQCGDIPVEEVYLRWICREDFTATGWLEVWEVEM